MTRQCWSICAPGLRVWARIDTSRALAGSSATISSAEPAR